MEVKIGVHHGTRELVFESNRSPEEIQQAVRDAMTNDDGLIEFVDERGRKILVRSEHLLYVEIGEPIERRVGFGNV